MTLPLKLLHPLAIDKPALAVIHDTAEPEYTGYVQNQGLKPWARVAGLPAQPFAWPAGENYRTVLLPLAGNRNSLKLCLAACASVLQPDGSLYLFGGNALGVKSAQPLLQTFFTTVELVSVGDHGRLYRAAQPLSATARLADLAQRQTFNLPDGPAALVSYPGLFAKGRLDSATALLLDHLPVIRAGSRVLDFACGTGVIAYQTRTQQPDSIVTLVDHDPLALLAAAENVPGAQACCLASPAGINGTYDLILSNPPIHTGSRLDHVIVEELVESLPRLLAPDGAAYTVAQQTVPLARMASDTKLAATEVAASHGFRVMRIGRA